MDHTICINSNSFPASCLDQGMILFEDAIQGVLQLYRDKDMAVLLWVPPSAF